MYRISLFFPLADQACPVKINEETNNFINITRHSCNALSQDNIVVLIKKTQLRSDGSQTELRKNMVIKNTSHGLDLNEVNIYFDKVYVSDDTQH